MPIKYTSPFSYVEKQWNVKVRVFAIALLWLFASTYRLCCALSHPFRSILYGSYNVLIAGAATDVAFETFADLSFGWIGIVFEQLVGGHNHTRCTETTLQSMLFPETFLQRMQVFF